MSINLSEDQIREIANRTVERIHEEEKYQFVSEIPNFPFRSIDEIHTLVRKRKLHFMIYTDVNLISRFGSHNNIRLMNHVKLLQTLFILLYIVAPIVLAFTLHNYCLLLTIPASLFGIITTSPTALRYIFILLAIGLFISSLFVNNQFWHYFFLCFSLANISINILRFINEGTILNIIYRNEHAFIWGFFNKAFLISVTKPKTVLMPGLPEQLQIINFDEVREAVYGK